MTKLQLTIYIQEIKEVDDSLKIKKLSFLKKILIESAEHLSLEDKKEVMLQLSLIGMLDLSSLLFQKK